MSDVYTLILASQQFVLTREYNVWMARSLRFGLIPVRTHAHLADLRGGGGVLWLELLIILVRHIIRLLLPGTRYLVYDYQEPGTRTYTKAMGNAGLERHGRSCGRAAISSAVIPGTHYLVKFWGTS